jgi:hypothetical protein
LWLVVDQLNIEKRGIPTVTIVRWAFEEPTRALIKDQGQPEMALVATEHRIASHNPEEIRKQVDEAFPAILKATTQWQPRKK